MSDNTEGFLSDQLSRPTPIFGLRLWIVLGISVGTAFVLVLFLIALWLMISKPNKSTSSTSKDNNKSTSQISSTYPMHEILIDKSKEPKNHKEVKSQIASNPLLESELVGKVVNGALLKEDSSLVGVRKVQVEVSHLGWGHWYTLKELEEATKGFSDDRVIGEGGYGIVYLGHLKNNTKVAIKNLLNNRGQAEREFKVEVEAIGRVRHKNLVRLLGYCAEGDHRMVVYEYMDNGNLEQWLHGEVGPYSPVTWESRMNIIIGTAKGLTYLHEGLEPKVVHRDVKSSNILLDKQWTSKVSDFGLAKLLGSERSYVTTRVMGTFGYVAPEYASTGMLNEQSDVYSFGILIMEIISGRNPVDFTRPPGEVNLVDWLKTMVANRNAEGVLDPKLRDKPSARSLKRSLLVAIKCVDPDPQKRPKMGQVIHMLEIDDFPFREGRQAEGKNSKHANDGMK
ncbi:probable serine/threonine-protein kinase At1g01540 isoform X2 [Papaver somniferum]|uniref:probable serine/threonine-protein kinase At1g01540 isoform X2 n=1 Tax=Papaver somniferum TaxID=3469 RepID=UPI000E6FC98B|nr:probable serine/threonine-protein kinase At1g01540 isoform X2 [Papaver somniferum]